MTANTWTHLAATYDGSVLRLYRNGAQIATANRTGSITTATARSASAATTSGLSGWRASDNITVYDKVLTTAQIPADLNKPVG